MLQELEGFTFATALDLNMGYYTIRLDPDASRICTIIFPWGKYSYKWLPMDIAGPPDIFKNENVRANENLGEVRRRLINKISSYQGKPQWSPGYIKKVLTGCEKQALNNAAKSKILYPWTGYLKYILTRDGIKPQSHEIEVYSQYILTLMSTN